MDFKTVFRRIIYDLRSNLAPIIALAVLWGLAELIFHEFCPVVIFSGFPCPGCGLTRAFVSFFTFHPIRAFEYNPSYPFWLAAMVAFIIRRYVQGKSTKILQFPMVAVCIITIGIYIWRMTHYFPSEEPMVFFDGNIMGRIAPLYNRFVKDIVR